MHPGAADEKSIILFCFDCLSPIAYRFMHIKKRNIFYFWKVLFKNAIKIWIFSYSKYFESLKRCINWCWTRKSIGIYDEEKNGRCSLFYEMKIVLQFVVSTYKWIWTWNNMVFLMLSKPWNFKCFSLQIVEHSVPGSLRSLKEQAERVLRLLNWYIKQ